MDPTLGIIYGFISLLGFGFGNAISKPAVERLGGVRLIFWRNLFSSSALLLILLFSLNSVEFKPLFILYTTILGVIGIAPLLSFYKALSLGKIGVVGPIAYTSSLFTILLSIIFYHETITIYQLTAFLLILFGTLAISINIREIKKSHLFTASSGVPYALIASLLWGLFFFLNKIAVNQIGPILAAFIVEMINVFVALAILRKKVKFPTPLPKTVLYNAAAVGLLGVIGALAYNQGVRVSNVSLIATIGAAIPLITTLYGRFVYKETLTKLQYVATALILLGLIIIGIS